MKSLNAKAPTMMSGLFFCADSFLVEGIPGSYSKGSKNQTNQTIGGNHDEHPEESPENLPLPRRSFVICGLTTDKLYYPCKKDNESYGEDKNYQGVQYVLTDSPEKSRDIHFGLI